MLALFEREREREREGERERERERHTEGKKQRVSSPIVIFLVREKEFVM